MTKSILYIVVLLNMFFFQFDLSAQGTTGGVLLKMPAGNFMNGNEFFSSTGYGSVFHAFVVPSSVVESSSYSSAVHFHKTSWDVNYLNGITTIPFGSKFAIGIGYKMLSLPSIPRKISTGIDGEFIEDGNMSVGSMAIPLFIGIKLNRNFYIGIKTEYYFERLDKYTVNSYNFGFNVKLDNLFNNSTSVSISSLNIGKKLKFYQESSSLPFLIFSEMKYMSQLFPVGFVLQLYKFKDEKIEFSSGIEYQFESKFYSHFGYRYQDFSSKGLIAGIGMKSSVFKFGYDYSPNQYFSNIHKISLYVDIWKNKTKEYSKNPSEKIIKKLEKILPIPYKLRYSYIAGELVIDWEYDLLNYPTAYFEVWASLNKNGKWIKISKDQLVKKSIVFKPTKKGVTFYFKVKAINKSTSSRFSKIIKVK